MKRIAFSFMLLCMSLTGLAQDVQGQQGQQGQHTQRRDFSPEAFWKMLQEYVNHEAGLSQEEGEKIYPMLKQMMGEQHKNNARTMEILRSCNESTSDAEYGTAIKQLLEIEVENKRIEETYYKKFHDVLSWQKIFEVRKALYKWNREALNRFTPRRRGGGQRHFNPMQPH